MKKNLLTIAGAAVLVIGGLASCTKDLNRTPTNSITGDEVYNSLTGYKQELGKVYSSFALTSTTGSGNSDLGGIDAGTSDFIRLYWNTQELPTDEAACVWNDPGVPDFHNMNWNSSNIILNGLYNRSIYQIKIVNEYLVNSTDAAVAGHGITGKDADSIKEFRLEARFLRAFQYWVLMDAFGNPPFITENDPTGVFPQQIKRADLFAYIEGELKSIDSLIVAPRTNEYGRVDRGAVWALMARMYLNAETYLGTGQGRYADALTYAKKVIDAGYMLKGSYKELFMADNNLNNPEVILSINYDGLNTQNFGGTTFLVNGSINGAMNPASFGVPNGGWGGNRTTKNLPLLFGDYSGATDKRAMFFGDKLDISNVTLFTDGLATTKWTNMQSNGTQGASADGTLCSTDFPLFRLAEMYLIYAEAQLRGGGGDKGTAIGYINNLRDRAYGNKNGEVTDLSLQDVLDERGRELYWEGFRRTDLIRYGKFTSSSYLWPWKGGVASGQGVDSHFSLYPLPASDLNANKNLTQNPQY